MSKKRNVVLYLDSDLVKKTRELGFNLSKTFENHLRYLVNHVDGVYAQNNSHGWWAHTLLPLKSCRLVYRLED